MAVLLLDKGKKAWSSREAMKISLATSPLAATWPQEQQCHLEQAFAELKRSDFKKLGEPIEKNAELLHAMLAASTPSIVFDQPATVEWKKGLKPGARMALPSISPRTQGAVEADFFQ